MAKLDAINYPSIYADIVIRSTRNFYSISISYFNKIKFHVISRDITLLKHIVELVREYFVHLIYYLTW